MACMNFFLIVSVFRIFRQKVNLTFQNQTDYHSFSGLISDNLKTIHHLTIPGRVAQSVMCLASDACLTADPGVASSIPARSHTFMEIDHEKISTVILLPSADSFKKGCCQLQAKVCAQITG